MKSTKNLLITGVALAIALFASVQVTAMGKKEKTYAQLTKHEKQNKKYYDFNPEDAKFLEKQRVNRFLNDNQKYEIWNKIYHLANVKRNINNTEHPYAYIDDSVERANSNKILKENIKHYKSIYYGNKPYTDEEIRQEPYSMENIVDIGYI